MELQGTKDVTNSDIKDRHVADPPSTQGVKTAIGGLFSRLGQWVSTHKPPTTKVWQLAPIITTKGKDFGFAGKQAKTGHPAVGMAHGSTYFEGGSPIATDQALVNELRRNKVKRLHVVIADGFGHPPQEKELKLIAKEAREVLSYAALPQVNSEDDYRDSVRKHLDGLCQEKGNPHSCRFSYGACLIESLAWREGDIAHVQFGGLGDSIGIVINGKGKVLLTTPIPTTNLGDRLSVAFNAQAVTGKEEKHAFYLDQEFKEDELLVITASDALLDAFEGKKGFDSLLFEKALKQCPSLQPQQLATFLYEEVERSVQESVRETDKGQRIPFAGDDTTIIVTRV